MSNSDPPVHSLKSAQAAAAVVCDLLSIPCHRPYRNVTESVNHQSTACTECRTISGERSEKCVLRQIDFVPNFMNHDRRKKITAG